MFFCKPLLPCLTVLCLHTTVFFTSSGQNRPSLDVWKINSGPIDPSSYYGVTLANGVLGIISSPELFKQKETVLNGTYDLYGRGRVSNFIRGFNFLNMEFSIDGTPLDASHVSGFTQELDMNRGLLTSTFAYDKAARVTYTVCALRQLPYTGLIDVTIHAEKDLVMGASSSMEAPDALRDVENYYNEIDRPFATLHLLTSTAKSPTGKLTFAASNTFLFDEQNGSEPRIIHEMWDNNRHLIRFQKTLKAGHDYHFAIAGSTISSAQNPDPLNEAERYTIVAKVQGSRLLMQQHAAAWKALWGSDIEINGDDSLTRDVHEMMYHLYSFVREGTAYSPSPMGLSGLGYNGHVFWDSELWMFPSLLLLHPELAKSMIEYRFERLGAARKNAFAHGFRGAMFPWESAESGGEETPVWALSGPLEQHITACVGMAAWNYYCVTQDKAWLKEKGFPILKDCADFWSSRVRRQGPGQFTIDHVVAADEWAEDVDNDAFTNAIAKACLQSAAKAAKIVGAPVDPDWSYVAANIPILKFPDGTIKEHAVYAGEKIKQADVNLLAYPLHERRAAADMEKDLSYYSARVGEGPAMTEAIFSILYSRLGKPDQALATFKAGYRPNKRPPFGVLAETATGNNPYFATGAGGLLQAMLNGFAGLEITDKGITQLKTRLPTGWSSMTVKGIGQKKLSYSITK